MRVVIEVEELKLLEVAAKAWVAESSVHGRAEVRRHCATKLFRIIMMMR